MGSKRTQIPGCNKESNIIYKSGIQKKEVEMQKKRQTEIKKQTKTYRSNNVLQLGDDLAVKSSCHKAMRTCIQIPAPQERGRCDHPCL